MPNAPSMSGSRCCRDASTSSCSASAVPSRRPTSPAPSRWPRAAAYRWSPATTCASSPPTEFESHEARVCIHDGALLADAGRARRYTHQQYLRSPQEMAALFADVPEALANSVEIARRCSLALTLGEVRLPEYPVPAGASTEEFLREESARGLTARFAAAGGVPPGHTERLRRELEVICQMGFAGYFLIVADFIRWAREQRGAGGTGARLGCRLAGSVQPADHRPRSDALRPAVRALPESRARVDAGLRHRLLHGRPRPRDRLRGGQVRPRARLADHHLRHHGRQGGGARRRPRAGASRTASSTASPSSFPSSSASPSIRRWRRSRSSSGSTRRKRK